MSCKRHSRSGARSSSKAAKPPAMAQRLVLAGSQVVTPVNVVAGSYFTK